MTQYEILYARFESLLGQKPENLHPGVRIHLKTTTQTPDFYVCGLTGCHQTGARIFSIGTSFLRARATTLVFRIFSPESQHLLDLCPLSDPAIPRGRAEVVAISTPGEVGEPSQVEEAYPVKEGFGQDLRRKQLNDLLLDSYLDKTKGHRPTLILPVN